MKRPFDDESEVNNNLKKMESNIYWNQSRKQKVGYSIQKEIRNTPLYKKRKKNMVYLTSLAVFVIILFIGYQSTFTNISNKKASETHESIKSTDEENDFETRELIQGLKAAQEQVSFKIILPELNLVPSSIREESSIEVRNYGVDYVEENTNNENLEELNGVRTTFGKGRKHIIISQTFDTGRPPDINELELLDITGAEAYLKPSEFGGPNRIYLWKDNLYFNISAVEVSVEELVAIARSVSSSK
ncbi:hypothetical protein [Halalkalibacter urbisdiaboli]|uniref:hypothetical protein n=1 Tax=Halalkalibacter urbisdiaboli TaxID=1960589 RepID=UPI000B43595E|nr:hypothetical protein [Halalkalibacter urbisdiaboli]